LGNRCRGYRRRIAPGSVASCHLGIAAGSLGRPGTGHEDGKGDHRRFSVCGASVTPTQCEEFPRIEGIRPQNLVAESPRYLMGLTNSGTRPTRFASGVTPTGRAGRQPRQGHPRQRGGGGEGAGCWRVGRGSVDGGLPCGGSPGALYSKARTP